MKNMLSEECLNHVPSIEATVENGWLPHDKLAEVVDVYYANRQFKKPLSGSLLGSAPHTAMVRSSCLSQVRDNSFSSHTANKGTTFEPRTFNNTRPSFNTQFNPLTGRDAGTRFSYRSRGAFNSMRTQAPYRTPGGNNRYSSNASANYVSIVSYVTRYRQRNYYEVFHTAISGVKIHFAGDDSILHHVRWKRVRT